MDWIDFIHQTTWESLPQAVQEQARRCLLDTLGAGLAGRLTGLSRIIHDHAAAMYPGQAARLWLDGRGVSPPGGALAGGMTIDALDIHDGHNLVKGHAGAAVVPAVLATATAGPQDDISGRELLASLVVGYEVALRAGLALHATACDYHTSGAWNTLGCAALTARRLRLSPEQTRHALGIAEYHGPRSPMMRCIDHPTMVKDGSGWGAMCGVSAAYLAREGFTGAPAELVGGPTVAELWSDLGERWRIGEQYFKPHAICRWAQPAVAAVHALQAEHAIPPAEVRRIRVYAFHQAVRLASRRPENTEQAQYNLPFPVAAALLHPRLGASELTGAALTDPAVLALAERVEMVEDQDLSARFPAERFSRVVIETASGGRFDSGLVQPAWGETGPPSDQDLRDKFRWLVGEVLPPGRIAALEELVWECAAQAGVAPLLEALAAPP